MAFEVGDLSPGKRSRLAEERASRLPEANAELRDVRQRLEAELRTHHPDLFDRSG